MKYISALSLLISFTVLIGCVSPSGQASAQTVQAIAPDEFEKNLQSSKDYQLIDVRTPEEYKEGHLPSAVNIHIYGSDFSAQIEKLDKEKPVFVYCKAGSRSAEAAAQMKDMGFKTIFELKGGIIAWKDAGKTVEAGEAKPASGK